MKCSDHHQPTTALATFPGFFLFKKGEKIRRECGAKNQEKKVQGKNRKAWRKDQLKGKRMKAQKDQKK
jgi:hypothetical protein